MNNISDFHKTPLIYILIPVHNRYLLTEQCLDSLYRQIYQRFKIIVIDDGSTDNTYVNLMQRYPEIVVLKGNGDLWWTGAINVGIRYVLNDCRATDYILTLNNDLICPPDYLLNLTKSIITYPNSLVGSLCIDISDWKTIHDGGVKVNWLSGKYTYINKFETIQYLPNSKDNGYFSVDFLPGRGTLIPLWIFNEIGIYNELKLPHYLSDYEFSNRAKQFGLQLIIDYQCRLFSHVKETGLTGNYKKLTWKNFLSLFYSIKSPYSIKYRVNFARLVCPYKYLFSFILLDLFRVLFHCIINQFRQYSIKLT